MSLVISIAVILIYDQFYASEIRESISQNLHETKYLRKFSPKNHTYYIEEILTNESFYYFY